MPFNMMNARFEGHVTGYGSPVVHYTKKCPYCGRMGKEIDEVVLNSLSCIIHTRCAYCGQSFDVGICWEDW